MSQATTPIITSNQDLTRKSSRELTFGPFRLDPQQRVIHRADAPVHLGSRAREILLTLLERAGEIVRKSELMARVWPDSVVDEGTLRVHISVLRKALGDGRSGMRYVENVTGHGYRFIAPVTEAHAVQKAHTVPVPLIRLIGRSDVMSDVVSGLPHRRLITIVGSGGIGKTTVAMAVADTLRNTYPDGICLVDLASISDPRLIPSTVASALGLATVSPDPMPSVIQYLKYRRMLIVLDSCEHVVEGAALLAERLLGGASPINVIATSREPLRAKSEWVLRLAPLELPPAAVLTAEESMRFSAVQLFVERAIASLDTFELLDADVPSVVDICRRLDGLPLAIEMAAARVDLFGVRALAARLDDRLGLLTKGNRTAVSRHQTLRATLDWSYQILPHVEQIALRRLAVFSGTFDLPSATVIMVEENEIDASKALDILSNLAAKSLLTVQVTGEQTLYRLLETSRAYALDRPESSEESAEIRGRHARLCCRWGHAERSSEPNSPGESTTGHGLDDVRAALDWCFSPHGDLSLGLSLTAASASSWFQSSFLDEYRRRLQQALTTLTSAPASDAAIELELNAALGDATLFTIGPSPSSTAAFNRTLELGEHLGTTVHHRRAVRGLCVGRIAAGDYQSAIGFAEALGLFVENSCDQASSVTADWLISLAYHLCGDQSRAHHHAERALRRPVMSIASLGDRPFQFEPRTAAYAVMARILWLQGFPDQAAHAAGGSLASAEAAGHPSSLCYALSVGSAIALYTGNAPHAERLIARLLDQSTRHCLSYWLFWGRCLEVALARLNGDSSLSHPGLSDPVYCRWHEEMLGTLHPQLATPEALLRAENGLAGWATAELLRVKAERLLAESYGNAVAAEAVLRESLDTARNQGALTWQLRTATSLARLWAQQGHVREAHDLLAAVYARFTEGFETADLINAKALLDAVRVAGHR